MTSAVVTVTGQLYIALNHILLFFSSVLGCGQYNRTLDPELSASFIEGVDRGPERGLSRLMDQGLGLGMAEVTRIGFRA